MSHCLADSQCSDLCCPWGPVAALGPQRLLLSTEGILTRLGDLCSPTEHTPFSRVFHGRCVIEVALAKQTSNNCVLSEKDFKVCNIMKIL